MIKRKVKTIIVMMLIILLPVTTTVFAGNEEDPEFVDKKFDVKLFGTFPFFPQMLYKNADFESVWFYELESTPEYLYVSMKIRDLYASSEKYEYIYVVDWTFNNIRYGASINLLPSGLTSHVSGALNDKGNDYINYVVCEGEFNDQDDIITWIIPKNEIGNPMKFSKISNIIPSTHIRFPLDSGKVKFDLFKDLPWNAKIIKDYTIQFQ